MGEWRWDSMQASELAGGGRGVNRWLCGRRAGVSVVNQAHERCFRRRTFGNNDAPSQWEREAPAELQEALTRDSVGVGTNRNRAVILQESESKGEEGKCSITAQSDERNFGCSARAAPPTTATRHCSLDGEPVQHTANPTAHCLLLRLRTAVSVEPVTAPALLDGAVCSRLLSAGRPCMRVGSP